MKKGLTAAIVMAALFGRLIYSQSRAPRLDSLVVSDMRTYHLLSAALIEKGYFGVKGPWSYRPPLYPFFLAGVYKIAGVSWPAARLAQALLGALSVWLLFLLSRRLVGPPAALLAAILAALDPSLIHLSGVFLSENLYIPLSLLLLLFLHRGFEGGLRSNFILAGVSGGLAALCRPAILPFLVLAALVPLAGARDRNGSARPKISAGIGGWALMIVTAALVISPWTVRNYRVHRRFVPISTNGGVMLWMGLHPGASGGYDFPRENNPLYGMRDEVERDRRGTRESLRFVRENPGEALVLAGKKFVLFWEFYPTTTSGKVFVVYLVLGAAGLLISLREWRRWLTIYLYAASFVGVHLLAHSGYRYRYPLHPIIALWSALALFALAGAVRRRPGRSPRKVLPET